MSQYILLKHIRVQNANALSSPFTYGFPAVTAFLGFSHAVQRHLNQDTDYADLLITGVGVATHEFDMQDHEEGYNRTLRLTANPLDKKGERPSFVEEGRCHFMVSLLLEIENLPTGRSLTRLLEKLPNLLLGRFKLAGGDILEMQTAEVLKNERKSARQLMPSYVLMNRRDLMIGEMEAGQDALDALHSYVQIHNYSEQDADGNVSWHRRRTQSGWLVPIAVGFHGISALGIAQQARDLDTLHRFAESLITLGEFIMPHRLENLSDMIWRYHHDGDFYACIQNSTIKSETQESHNG